MSESLSKRPEISSERYIEVALLGLPNVGKSTLMNGLIKKPLSITCRKAQTTRRSVHGIINIENTQISLRDTPGWINQSTTPLHHKLKKSTIQSLHQASILVWVMDANRHVDSKSHDSLHAFFQDYHQTAIRQHKNVHFMVLINKIDCIEKEHLFSYVDALPSMWKEHPVWMMNARSYEKSPKEKDYVTRMIRYWASLADLEPWLYDHTRHTSDSTELLLQDITRKHLLERLHEEVPYNLTVKTECIQGAEKSMQKNASTAHQTTVYQTIVLGNERHKKILLGEQGDVLRYVREKSLKDMRALLKKPITLHLHVKCDEKWLERATKL